jgi:hypothetical protein
MQKTAPNTQATLAQVAPSPADAERTREMQAAWKAYRGKLKQPLKVDANQPNDNVLSNRCAPIVDKGVSFLFGPVLKIEVAEQDNQDFLDGLWGDDDDRMTLLSQAAINGGVCGQTFVKLIPAQGQMKFPRLVVLDSQLIRIVTDPDDCSLTLAYVIEYAAGPAGDVQKRQIIARVDPDNMAGIAGEYDLDDSWTITNYVRTTTGPIAWIQVGERETWPYPFAPIFTCQNLPNPNEAWGVPDLTPDLIGMNEVYNFVQSNTSRIIKYHGHQKTWAKGVNASQISVAIDDIICLPSPESSLGTLPAMENLTGLLNFSSVLRSDMDEQSRVPAVALGRMVDLPKGNISGVALQLLFQPLIEKTTQKQRLYGKMIREICRGALVVGGKLDLDAYEDFQVDLRWQNLLPVDDLAAAQTALILKQLGVSGSTIMQQLGYDPEIEADKSAKEDAVKLTSFAKGQGMPPAQQVPQVDQQQQNQAGMGQS